VSKTITDWSTWCHDIIHGSGGLEDYKRYELAIYNGCKDRNHDHDSYLDLPATDEHKEAMLLQCEASHYTIRCLARNAEALRQLKILAEERGTEWPG